MSIYFGCIKIKVTALNSKIINPLYKNTPIILIWNRRQHIYFFEDSKINFYKILPYQFGYHDIICPESELLIFNI